MFGQFNRDDMVDFKMEVDPNLKNDTVLQKGDTDITYGDIKQFMSLQRQEPIKCLVYWDDVCQLTSIGLLEVVNAVCKSDAKIDIVHFLTRPNEYCYGIDYVCKLYENVIKRDDIIALKRRFYWPIMQISLKTLLFRSIVKLDTYFDKLGFYFPFKFETANELKSDFNKIFFKNKGNNGISFYYAQEDKVGFNKLVKQEGYNSVITPNIATTFRDILSDGLGNITILGPDNHNGLTDEMYKFFYKNRKFPLPNDCKVSLFPEVVTD